MAPKRQRAARRSTRLCVAVSALTMALPPMAPARAAAGTPPGMRTGAQNAALPAARNNLNLTRLLTDFGAKCDGSSDDQAAFAAASAWLATAGQRIVQLPAGTCVTSQTVTVGDGREISTSLSAIGHSGDTTLAVASTAGIQNGDAVYVIKDSGFWRGTVNGTPSGNSVPITPALDGTASSGNLVYTGHVSTWQGGGFVGFGGCSPQQPGTAVSTIKYIGAAAPTTTLGATAATGALTLTVAATAGINLGDAIGVVLDSGSVWWTHVTQTPSGTTLAIANEMPSQASAGNTVTTANNPVVRVQGPMLAPVVEGVCLDANSLAAVGLEVIAANDGRFRGPGGVGALNYTGIGLYLHSREALLGAWGGSSNSHYEPYALLPANTHTIGMWLLGGAARNIAFSRNQFYGGQINQGGADATAAGIREEYADNNTFIRPFVYTSGGSGAGLYRQPTPNKSGFGAANVFINASLLGGVTDGTATGGSLGTDFFWTYGVDDGEPVPTGAEAGTDTGGNSFGLSSLELFVPSTTAKKLYGYSSAGGTYIFGLGRGANSGNGLKVESFADIGFYTHASSGPDSGTLNLQLGSTTASVGSGITNPDGYNGHFQAVAAGTGTAGYAAYSSASGGSLIYDIRRGGASGNGMALESGSDIGFYVGAGAVGTSSLAAEFDSKSHLRVSGAPPTLSSCGTSPAISGSDIAGQVTLGTGSPTGCTITFSQAYTSAPYCAVTWQANLATMQYSVSANAITLTQTATSSNKVNYTCAAPSGG